MPCEDVDPTAVAVPVEADLNEDLPAPGAQPVDEQRLQARVRRIEQTVEIGASPAWDEVEPDLEHGKASVDGSHRQPSDMPSLEVGPGGPMHAGALGAIDLTPAAPPAQRTDDTSQLQLPHGRMLRRTHLPGGLRSLTGRFAYAYRTVHSARMTGGQRFRTTIEAARAGGAVALIPPDCAAALGGLRQMRVTGTINGVPFRSSTMPYGGRGLFLGVHKATREAAGVELGDEVEITLVRDDSPRTLELAPELEAAFVAHPELRERFDALSFSRRRELAEPIAEARKPETRAARLEKALARLGELG
jgi:Domain of unknown function (DUF1905)/Bacteriocin-protection, YdeI or OmpD-Associated